MSSGTKKLVRVSILMISIVAMQGCMEFAKKYEQGVNAYKSTVNKYTGKGDQQQAQQQNQASQSGATASSQSGGNKVARPDPNTTQIMQLVQWWHKREPYFKELPFDGGSYKIIQSPSDKFTNLYIPTFKGLPRVGLSPTFGVNKNNQNAHRNDPHLYTKRAFTEKLERDMNTYIVLKFMSMKKNLFTAKRLKVDQSSQAKNQLRRKRELFSYKHIIPRFHMEHMAGTLLSPATYEKYLCVKTHSGCDKYSMPRAGRVWGGSKANEFTANKSFNDFVNSVMPDMLRFGDKLSSTLYLVTPARLSEYDFDNNGFKVSIDVNRSDLVYVTDKRKPAIFKEFKNSYSTYLKMSADKAENFQKRLGERKGRLTGKQLYAVMKVKLDEFVIYKPDAANRARNRDYQVNFADNKVSFYFDEDLKEKILVTGKFN